MNEEDKKNEINFPIINTNIMSGNVTKKFKKFYEKVT